MATGQSAFADHWRNLQFHFDTRLHLRLESLIVLLILLIAMSVLSPYFLSVSNFLNILLATSTIGMTLTMWKNRRQLRPPPPQ